MTSAQSSGGYNYTERPRCAKSPALVSPNYMLSGVWLTEIPDPSSEFEMEEGCLAGWGPSGGAVVGEAVPGQKSIAT